MGLDLLILCAFTEATEARALEAALRRIAVSARVRVDDMRVARVDAMLPDALTARVVLILISPNSLKAETIQRAVGALMPEKLIAAVVKWLPEHQRTPPDGTAKDSEDKQPTWFGRQRASFELSGRSVDMVRIFEKASHDLDLGARAFTAAVTIGESSFSPRGLLQMLGDRLDRPGLADLGSLDAIRKKIASGRVSVAEWEKLKGWLDTYGDDPAAPMVQREIASARLSPQSAMSRLQERRRQGPEERRTSAWFTRRTLIGGLMVSVAGAVAIVGSGSLKDGLTSGQPVSPKYALPPPNLEGLAPRLALVIGVSRYSGALGNLPNPVRDARLMATTLQDKLRFTTNLVIDPDRAGMERALLDFTEKVDARGDSANAFVYFAGHGIQVGAVNYLIPRDGALPAEVETTRQSVVESLLRKRFVAVDEVLDYLGERPRGVNILVLDACRNNPLVSRVRRLTRSVGAADGFVRDTPPSGTIIAYSTEPGSFSQDGDGDNSPYAVALSRAIVQPGRDIFDVFNAVRTEMAGTAQRPIESNGLSNNFYFVTPTGAPAKIARDGGTP